MDDKLTLPEIYASLGRAKRAELQKAIADATNRLSQTVWNWCKGKTIPASVLERKAAAKAVNKTLFIRTTAETLFPEE